MNVWSESRGARVSFSLVSDWFLEVGIFAGIAVLIAFADFWSHLRCWIEEASFANCWSHLRCLIREASFAFANLVTQLILSLLWGIVCFCDEGSHLRYFGSLLWHQLHKGYVCFCDTLVAFVRVPFTNPWSQMQHMQLGYREPFRDFDSLSHNLNSKLGRGNFGLQIFTHGFGISDSYHFGIISRIYMDY